MTMHMPEFKAVIFDMDGVIFDTEKLVLECWQIIAEKYHIPDIEEACRACLGLNQEAAKDEFIRRYGGNFPYWDYKAEMRAVFFGPKYGKHLPIKKGARELLAYLKDRQIPVALASSTRSAVVLKELQDAELICYFDQIICGDMVSRSKPDPEIFLTAAKALGVPAGDCLAIEDSYNGIRAAAAGGLMPVMVPDMLPADAEMREKSVLIVSSLAELEAMLRQERTAF